MCCGRCSPSWGRATACPSTRCARRSRCARSWCSSSRASRCSRRGWCCCSRCRPVTRHGSCSRRSRWRWRWRWAWCCSSCATWSTRCARWRNGPTRWRAASWRGPCRLRGEADEIGRLSFAFEEMRRALRDKLRSTESLNVDLEREVRRRTEVLEQRNAELHDALEKLRRAQNDLIRSEKLASMGRLVAGIAHEINNPVNAVINTLAPLEEAIKAMVSERDGDAAARGADEAQEMLRVVQRGAARTKGDRPGAAQLFARRRAAPARAGRRPQRRRHAGPAAPPAAQRPRREDDRSRAARARLPRPDRSGVHEPDRERGPGGRHARQRRHDPHRRPEEGGRRRDHRRR